MSATPETDLRYPVGKFQLPATIAHEDREQWIETLADLPENLRNAVLGWNQHKLDTPYREGGWTVRQLLHHIADSHMNAYMRIRLALTEDWPTVTAYDEVKWAKLHDATSAPVEWSLELVEALHARWVMLLESLQAGDWKRGYKHPEAGQMTIEQVLALYAWHSRHHTAHITHLQQRMGW